MYVITLFIVDKNDSKIKVDIKTWFYVLKSTFNVIVSDCAPFVFGTCIPRVIKLSVF